MNENAHMTYTNITSTFTIFTSTTPIILPSSHVQIMSTSYSNTYLLIIYERPVVKKLVELI